MIPLDPTAKPHAKSRMPLDRMAKKGSMTRPHLKKNVSESRISKNLTKKGMIGKKAILPQDPMI